MDATRVPPIFAFGVAVLIAIAHGHTAGMAGVAHPVAVAEGSELAFWLAAGGMIVGLPVAAALPNKTRIDA